MKQLNKEQREFLEYIRDNHRCMGWTGTVNEVLNKGEYSIATLAELNFIIKKFKASRLDNYIQARFERPTKYLK